MLWKCFKLEGLEEQIYKKGVVAQSVLRARSGYYPLGMQEKWEEGSAICASLTVGTIGLKVWMKDGSTSGRLGTHISYDEGTWEPQLLMPSPEVENCPFIFCFLISCKYFQLAVDNQKPAGKYQAKYNFQDFILASAGLCQFLRL